MGRRDRRLAGLNLLELVPVPVADHEEVEGRIVVVRPRPPGRGPRAVAKRMLVSTGAPRLNLDEIGSFVWRRLDGRHSVAELAEAVRERFGEDAEPCEERVGAFVRQLHGQELVAYRGVDPEAEGPAPPIG